MYVFITNISISCAKANARGSLPIFYYIILQEYSVTYAIWRSTKNSAGPGNSSQSWNPVVWPPSEVIEKLNGIKSSTCSWGPLLKERIFPLLCRRARIHGNCCLADNCAAALCTDGKHGSVSLRVNSTIWLKKSLCRSGVPTGPPVSHRLLQFPRTWWSPAYFQTHPNHNLGFISNQYPIYIPLSHSISHYI